MAQTFSVKLIGRYSEQNVFVWLGTVARIVENMGSLIRKPQPVKEAAAAAATISRKIWIAIFLEVSRF